MEDDIKKIFQRLHDNTLSDIVSLHYSQDDDLFTATRSKQIKGMVEDAIYSGIHIFLHKLALITLKTLLADANMEVKKSGKASIIKPLKEHIDDTGVNEWAEQLPAAAVKAVCKDLKIAGQKKKDIINWIRDESLNSFFRQFAAQELQQWCLDSNLEASTQSKKALVEALVSQKTAKKKKKVAPQNPLGDPDLDLKDKPALKKGITAANVFQYYKGTELRDWLKAKDIRTEGKLKDLALRTVEVLEGTYEAPEKKERGRKRKRGDKDDGSDSGSEEEEIPKPKAKGKGRGKPKAAAKAKPAATTTTTTGRGRGRPRKNPVDTKRKKRMKSQQNLLQKVPRMRKKAKHRNRIHLPKRRLLLRSPLHLPESLPEDLLGVLPPNLPPSLPERGPESRIYLLYPVND